LDEGVVVELLEDVDGDSLHQIIDDWLMLILVGTELADGGHGLIDLGDSKLSDGGSLLLVIG
jgi:hypothetical protein